MAQRGFRWLKKAANRHIGPNEMALRAQTRAGPSAAISKMDPSRSTSSPNTTRGSTLRGRGTNLAAL
eukprot:185165-Lingulodinium_polyedra.AAC.1